MSALLIHHMSGEARNALRPASSYSSLRPLAAPRRSTHATPLHSIFLHSSPFPSASSLTQDLHPAGGVGSEPGSGGDDREVPSRAVSSKGSMFDESTVAEKGLRESEMVLANREQNSDTMAINNTGKTQPRARAVQGVGEQISRYAAHAIAGVTRVKLASKTEPASS